MTTLPSRLTEKSFRKYEQDIKLIVDSYPSVVILDHAKHGVEITTYRARLSDAMLSLYTNRWNTSIDLDTYDKVYNDIVISHQQYVVVAGARQMVRNWNKPQTKEQTNVEQLPEQESTITDVNSLQKLCEKVVATGRPHKVKDLSVEDITFVQENFDIVVKKNKDDSYTLR